MRPQRAELGMESTKMSGDENKATIRRLFAELWTGDIAAADRYYAPGPLRDGLKRFATDLYQAVPDWRVTIDDLVSEGDKVVVRWTGRGTHLGEWNGASPTGRPVSTTGIDIERFVDGQIVQEDGEVDMLGFLRQIEGGGSPTSSDI
jgi:predicted ester cyclase